MGSIAEPKKSVMRKGELRSWRSFRESRWAKNERNREGGDEQKNGLDGMAITERGVRHVVNEREEEYDGSEWKRKRIATKEEHDYAKDCCQSEAGIEEEDGTGEKGVCGAKIAPARFGAEPCGGEAAKCKARFECRMCSDKVPSEAAFFVQVGILAELCVKADFTEARNAPDPADGVLIKDVVVADPKFERKTRAQRDETLEAEEVAYGPGSAAKNNNRDAKKSTEFVGAFTF